MEKTSDNIISIPVFTVKVRLLVWTHLIRKGVSDMIKEVPIWEKANLTLEEAAAYFNIGINKLRELTNDDRCKFVLWCGSKRLIKRLVFEKYLAEMYSV